jgi:hypothetical protein
VRSWASLTEGQQIDWKKIPCAPRAQDAGYAPPRGVSRLGLTPAGLVRLALLSLACCSARLPIGLGSARAGTKEKHDCDPLRFFGGRTPLPSPPSGSRQAELWCATARGTTQDGSAGKNHRACIAEPGSIIFSVPAAATWTLAAQSKGSRCDKIKLEMDIGRTSWSCRCRSRHGWRSSARVLAGGVFNDDPTATVVIDPLTGAQCHLPPSRS